MDDHRIIDKRDVVVLGAGIAGLSASLRLAESGLRVLVVEVKNRIGGRIFTQYCDNVPIELGAEFVHGKPPELWRVIRRAALDTYEAGGRNFWTEAGRLQDRDESTSTFDDDLRWIDKLKTWTGEDRSFAKYLAEENVAEESRPRLIQYVEGYNAADQQKIGVIGLGLQQSAQDAIDGDRSFRLSGGYSKILDYFAKRLYLRKATVVLGTRVENVTWKPGIVTIRCRDLESRAVEFSAERVVVALPLGVLKSDTVHFTPVPEIAFAAIRRLEIGHVCKVVLQFQKQFWAETRLGKLKDLGFLFSPGTTPPVWWTQYPVKRPCLTAWSGGPNADQMMAVLSTNPELELTRVLGHIFDIPQQHLRDLLLRCDTHDWQADPFARGAYSYVPEGGMQALRTLTEPIENTLFFAGEHTDSTGHWGTVHGALLSGMRAASQILKL